MFDALSEKLQATLADVRGRGTLTEDDVNKAMREIRLALLEADVNFKVVKQFTTTVKERCLGADVDRPAQPRPAGRQDRQRGAHRADGRRVGRASRSRRARRRSSSWPACRARARRPRRPSSPATCKEEHGSSVAVAACDVYRPAAVEQLVKVGAPGRRRRSTSRAPTRNPVDIARWALDRAKQDGKDVLIVDTAGRLHVDEALMQELDGHPQRRSSPHIDPARRRRDDRPGRRQRRRAVRRGASTSTAS